MIATYGTRLFAGAFMLAAWLAPGSALAQSTTSSPPNSVEPNSVEQSPVGPTPDEPSPPRPEAEPKLKTYPSLFLGPVERVPSDANPELRVRGISGGSLWLERDFHGLQWPYYPGTGIGISGSGWVDTGLRRFDVGKGLGTGESKGIQFVQQSRILLRVTPTWTNGETFFQMQAEFVAAKLDTGSNGILWSADDAWIRGGKWNRFDVLVGRFEAWEDYHYGMGLDLYTLERNGANGDSLGVAPTIYGLTYMFGRQDSLGQAALHLYPYNWLRFEVGLHFGPELNGANTWGVRPVAVFDLGWLKLKGGAELRDQTGQADGSKLETLQQGGAGAVQVVVDPYAEAGVNFAYATTDTRDDRGRINTRGTFHTYSVGGFANARVVEDVLVGAGLDYTLLEDTNYDSDLRRNDRYDHWQPFGAVQATLYKQIFIKAVFAYAIADLNPIPVVSGLFKSEMFSGRVRVLYLF